MTLHQPDGEPLPIYDAAMRYQSEGVPLVDLRRPGVRHRQLPRLGGQGDAAARRAGGRRAELRAHPPLEPRRDGRAAAPVSRRERARRRLGLDGTETYDLEGLAKGLAPRQETPLTIRRKDGSTERVSLRVRIDTPDRGRLLPARRHPPVRSPAAPRMTDAGSPSARRFLDACSRPPRRSPARLADAPGRAVPAGVPGDPPHGLLPGALPFGRPRGRGVAPALPPVSRRTR